MSKSQTIEKSRSLIHDPRPTTHDRLSPPVWIEVDLAAIRRNLREVRRFLGPRVRVLAVVKANAYGHGLIPVSETLAQAGADGLGVASVVEAVALRRAGLERKILVLGSILPEDAPVAVRHRLTLAVGDGEVAEALSRAATVQETAVEVHLKVDTGMARYGVWHEEALGLARRLAQLPGLKMGGILTHLATAGQNADAAQEQLNRFVKVIERFSRAKLPVGLKHAANSVAFLKFQQARQDLIRTGLLLYGASPIKREEHLPLSLAPALSLKSRVRFLKTIPAGQTVSYGGTWRAPRPTKLATIPVGYAHGYVRALSNRAQLLVRGRRA